MNLFISLMFAVGIIVCQSVEGGPIRPEDSELLDLFHRILIDDTIGISDNRIANERLKQAALKAIGQAV